MSFYNNIPVYVILQGDDDVDSMISFATGTSSSVTPEDDQIMMDSESRWALEPVSCNAAPLRSCPHHPERSVSYSSNTNMNANNMAKANNNNTSTTKQILTPIKNSYSNSPTSRLMTLRQKPTAGLRQKHAGLGRTTRLTRMAERAKAVARNPISRRGSRNHQQRQSLPAIPIRHKSSSIDTSSRRSSAPVTPSSTTSAICIDCVSLNSSSGRSSSLSRPSRSSYKQRRNSSMIPRRRNSSIKPQRRNSIHCITARANYNCRDGTTIILTASSSLTSSNASKQRRGTLRGGRRATTGCFQISCSASSGLIDSDNRPPRLPQRYPSEIPMAA